MFQRPRKIITTRAQRKGVTHIIKLDRKLAKAPGKGVNDYQEYKMLPADPKEFKEQSKSQEN